jgi:hypothetical protein
MNGVGIKKKINRSQYVVNKHIAVNMKKSKAQVGTVVKVIPRVYYGYRCTGQILGDFVCCSYFDNFPDRHVEIGIRYTPVLL